MHQRVILLIILSIYVCEFALLLNLFSILFYYVVSEKSQTSQTRILFFLEFQCLTLLGIYCYYDL